LGGEIPVSYDLAGVGRPKAPTSKSDRETCDPPGTRSATGIYPGGRTLTWKGAGGRPTELAPHDMHFHYSGVAPGKVSKSYNRAIQGPKGTPWRALAECPPASTAACAPGRTFNARTSRVADRCQAAKSQRVLMVRDRFRAINMCCETHQRQPILSHHRANKPSRTTAVDRPTASSRGCGSRLATRSPTYLPVPQATDAQQGQSTESWSST